jgi:hypothetical protein
MALDRSTALALRSTFSVFSVFSILAFAQAMACTPAPQNQAQADNAGAPDPAVVCQHLRTLAAKENGDEQVLDQVQRQCVQTLHGLQSRYVSFANCVESATTSAAVLQCETELAKPPSLLAAASPTAQLESLCDHVIGLLRAEIPEMGTSVQASEVDALRQRCITDAGAKLHENGAEAFAQQSTCILAATNLQTLQACGSF